MREQTITRGAERGRIYSQDRTLNTQQSRIIEAMVMRAPARDLARVLQQLRARDAEVWGDSEPEEEEAMEHDDDGVDLEGWEADAEGDATEDDQTPLLDDLLLSEDDLVLSHHVRTPSTEDVILIPIKEGKMASLQLISGLSGNLLALRQRDGVTGAYHDALRKRVAATLAIAARILKEYGAEGLQCPQESSGRLRRDKIRTALGLSETQMSGLLAGATLRTPDGRTQAMRLFFAPYSAEEDTDELLLRVLAERAAKDRQSPLSDAMLAELVNDELSRRGRKPIQRAALRVSRDVRLGLPATTGRARRYAAGETLAGMVASAPGSGDQLTKWKRLLEPLKTHKNAGTRATVAAWLSELNARRDSEKSHPE